MQGSFEVLRALKLVGVLPQRLCNSGVQNDVRVGNGRGGAEHTELKLVAGKGKWRGAVAIGRVLREFRQDVDADLQKLLLLRVIGRVGFDRVQNLRQLRAEEHGHDGGRRFVRAQPVVVARRGHGNAQQVLIIVNGLNNGAQEQQELRVLTRRFAGFEQVDACVGRDRPVVVLAGAVDARKGLFVQQTDHAVLAGDLLQQLHGQLVVVGGNIGGRENRRKLMLRGGDLIVLGLGQNAELPEFLVQILHERGHARLDGAEIMVVQLLPLRRLRAEERAARVEQVLALIVKRLVDEEIFLLRADRRAHSPDGGVAEELQDA